MFCYFSAIVDLQICSIPEWSDFSRWLRVLCKTPTSYLIFCLLVLSTVEGGYWNLQVLLSNYILSFFSSYVLCFVVRYIYFIIVTSSGNNQKIDSFIIIDALLCLGTIFVLKSFIVGYWYSLSSSFGYRLESLFFSIL
jgi:hypothetical protein